MADDLPLEGLLVLDMAQFLSGPYAALRLGDLGARVIKVERPGGGDICRSLYLTDTDIGGDSTLFHAINRNKESIALDYRAAADRAVLYRLAERADVVIQNFRPGVADRLDVGPQALRALNPRLIVGISMTAAICPIVRSTATPMPISPRPMASIARPMAGAGNDAAARAGSNAGHRSGRQCLPPKPSLASTCSSP